MIGNLDLNTDLVVQSWDPEKAATAFTPAKLPRPFNSSAAQLFVLPPVSTGTSYELLTQIIRDETKGINSVLAATAIDHACARVKSFTDFGDDWDGEGAGAPVQSCWTPPFFSFVGCNLGIRLRRRHWICLGSQ